MRSGEPAIPTVAVIHPPPPPPPPVPHIPNAPNAASLSPGSGTDLVAAWTAPATDATHDAATGYNLRSSPSGAGTWTVVSGVFSPATVSGLAAGAAIDVQVQSVNATGVSAWSASSTMTTAVAAGPYAPNAPAIASVVAPPDGSVTKLVINWTAPATDGTHGAATGYNARVRPTGSGAWTTMTGVTSPYIFTGLTGGAAFDVQVQATNAAASPGTWSASTTISTWGATVAQGAWVAASSQTHGTGVAPNGGLMATAVAAPTAVSGVAFAWSTGNAVPPTSGLIAAGPNGQTNGWGAYLNTPATAGTYYVWLLAQGAGAATSGALVSGPITVS